LFCSGVLSGREPVRGVKKLLTVGAALGAVACGFLAVWHDRQRQVAFAEGVFGLGMAFASRGGHQQPFAGAYGVERKWVFV